MIRNIEKYFLFIFVFAISLVNVTPTFALGKIELLSDKNPILKGKVDTEVCKRDASKAGLAQYSETCRKQCTSTEAKYTKFKEDNKAACEFLAAAGGSNVSGTPTPTVSGASGTGTQSSTTGSGAGSGAPIVPAAGAGTGGTGGVVPIVGTVAGTVDAVGSGGADAKKGETPPKKGEPTIEEKAEIDKKVSVENPSQAGTSATSGAGTSGTDDAGAQAAGSKEEKTTNKEIDKNVPVEEPIPVSLVVIPDDLSTKEAFDKIKEVFDVTVERIPHTDLNAGADAFEDDDAIENTGLVPVRVTITPKDGASETNNQALLEQLKKAFNQRIIDLAKNEPINLGATLHTAPAPETLYEAIYNAAVAGLDLTNVEKIITDPGTSIKSESFDDDEILNAWVIAVRERSKDNAIDILLQLDGVKDYVSPFEKLSGVEVSYAHIADPAATGADFVAPKNFVEGLASGTEATDDCPRDTTLFVDRLKANPTCKNLLKITVPTDTTAEFGIADGPDLAPNGSPEDHAKAAKDSDTYAAIEFILKILQDIKSFTTYFNPDDANLYASTAIKNQLKSSRNVVGFEELSIDEYSWPASEYVQAVIAKLSIQSVVFLLRVANDLKSIYLTKNIVGPPAPPAPPTTSHWYCLGGVFC